MDGRGLSAYSWGSSVILAGPGPSFHLAFGTRGFSSGSMASEKELDLNDQVLISTDID